jgi:sugar/nucleoside kinase (ribokinase family)
VIALLGNLSRDLLPGEPPRPGGAPYHAARAFRRLHVPGRIVARCAVEDRAELFDPVVRLGTAARYVSGTTSASFEISYEGDHRLMSLAALGDVWWPDDVPPLPDAVRWVHVAPLARSDFPAETIAALARHRRVLLDGQGLVRVPEVGPLRLDAGYDPEILRHVWALKLSEEEAEVLGDPHDLGVREVLLTHGSRGMTLIAEGRETQLRSRAVATENPTGAGDAFCTAYVAARSTGTQPADAARQAASLVAALLGAR